MYRILEPQMNTDREKFFYDYITNEAPAASFRARLLSFSICVHLWFLSLPSSDSRQSLRVLVDLAEGLGDLVHVRSGAEERGLGHPDGLLAQAVVCRAMEALQVVGDPPRRIDGLEGAGLE